MIKSRILTFIDGLQTLRKTGFNDYCIFTHAFHESGRFIKVIGNHNYWGIKVPRQWTGVVHTVTTHEYTKKIEGENQEQALQRIWELYGRYDVKIKRQDDIFWVTTLNQRFIDFKTLPDALEWYCDFIKRLYPNAYSNRHNPIEYFNGLINGSLQYATDPRYVEKLEATMTFLRNYKEYEYIKKLLLV